MKSNIWLAQYHSFEHDFVENESRVEKKKGSPSPQLITNVSKEGGQTTIWNAKVGFYVDYRTYSMIACRNTDLILNYKYILGTICSSIPTLECVDCLSR